MLQNRGELGSARLVILRRLWQQKARFQIGEPSRHHQVVGRDLKAQLALPSDKIEVLVGESQDRDFGEIDLLLAGQREQQIDRPFITVELEHELVRPIGEIGLHPLCPVIKSTNLYSASAGPPITQPRMFRLIPIFSPTNGMTKRNRSRINIP